MLTVDRIICSLDFEQDGKHFGNLELGFSDNRHAFSKIPVPLVCIRNGSGPTLLWRENSEHIDLLVERSLARSLCEYVDILNSRWRLTTDDKIEPQSEGPAHNG
ncbi:MAG: hypothetical protein QF636_03365 [Arenicellales bacterium]|jgi:hypothetical protein|nr:hypothetical protein [Arenicellales bacterium]MDP6290965.1 hypothetical protein [Arenicellales bacterium]|tara:strand:- start:725 stop:1036 length:312 start_codon:yes stop_codon:yes gene_type:complete